MAETYMRFRVQLADVKPAIWRQFLIRADATFLCLHEAIQNACGWDQSHLFAFRDRKKKEIACGPMDDDDGAGDDGPNASKVRLAGWFSITKNKLCSYEYDFGDSWLHEVRLEALEQHDGRWLRQLLDGARSFPPEDCGGIGAYWKCVEVVKTGKDPEGMAQWIGHWHPDHFDLAKTQKCFDR